MLAPAMRAAGSNPETLPATLPGAFYVSVRRAAAVQGAFAGAKMRAAVEHGAAAEA
jgi:hypothetical protein